MFHRLEVFIVDVPPLRERPGDVLPIARMLLGQMENELAAHDWPGNVRELRNVLCRAADQARGARWIDASAVDRALRKPRKTAVELTPETAKECLELHGGNISAAARAAGVARTTFRKALGGAAAQVGPGTRKTR